MKKINGDYFYTILYGRFCAGAECRNCEMKRGASCALIDYDRHDRTKVLAELYEKFYGNIIVSG